MLRQEREENVKIKGAMWFLVCSLNWMMASFILKWKSRGKNEELSWTQHEHNIANVSGQMSAQTSVSEE